MTPSRRQTPHVFAVNSELLEEPPEEYLARHLNPANLPALKQSFYVCFPLAFPFQGCR